MKLFIQKVYEKFAMLRYGDEDIEVLVGKQRDNPNRIGLFLCRGGRPLAQILREEEMDEYVYATKESYLISESCKAALELDSRRTPEDFDKPSPKAITSFFNKIVDGLDELDS